MNILHLSGYGVKIKVDNMRPKSQLVIEDGRQDFKQGQTFKFRPRKIPYDSIVIDGHSGYISLQAFHWLSRNKIPVHILNFEGSLISSILPPMPIKADLRIAQIEASKNPDMKFKIAYELVKAKLQRTHDVLKWLRDRYDIEKKFQKVERESLAFSKKAKNVKDLRIVEGRVALRYWETIRTVIPETFDFHGRITKKHQYNAVDPVNLALNYAYGVLKGECRKAVNIVGLEPSIGFLHETAQPKYPLVYDLQEPFRWIVDTVVISCLENEIFKNTDFFLTDNYILRLESEAIKILLEELRAYFNSRAKYNHKNYSWDVILKLKTQEIAKYILGRDNELDLIDPFPELHMEDSKNMRAKILSLTPSHARRIGINKSTLWNLQNRTRSKRPLKIYRKVAEKISGCN